VYSWFFVNLANILFALAYLVKDIFWLRMISVVACAANGVYLFIAPDKPLWWGIGWDAVFVVINVIQIWILLRDKRTVRLGPEEKEIYESVFKQCTPLEFRRLLNVTYWKDYPAGTVLAREDETLPSLMLIYSGAAKVEKKGRQVALLKSGDFVGEMSYVSESKATATVMTTEVARLMCWDKAKLTRLMDSDNSLKLSLDSVLSCNMADKLNRHA